MTDDIGPHPAVYARRSTEDQSDQHQLDDVKRWLDYQGLDMGDGKVFVETANGASSDRPKFRALTTAVETGAISDVVVWEISRVARNGLLAQEFFEACKRRALYSARLLKPITA